MKQKYVVLHAPKPAPDRTFRDSEATIAGAPKFRMSAEDLDQKEAARIARDPDFVAAPIMPVRLIEPLVRTADKWTSLSEARGDGVHGTFKNGDTPVDDEDIAWGVRAVRAHTSPFTGKDIVVAVLDTGIEANHPAFPAGLSIEQQDFTGEGNGDMHGHGTHCAGTIFGRPVDGVRIGVAPGVTRALIGKVLGAKGGGASYDIAKAIQWAADSGANVISMSLGIDFPGFVRRMVEEDGMPPDLATSRALEGYRFNVMLFERLAAVLRVSRNGVILTAAAGNESRRDLDKRFEIAVSPPAVSDGFISVAAVGQATGVLRVADFSNTGASVCAPGVDIPSANHRGGLATMSGTSMATPHVAGVAALWAEKILKHSPLSAMQFAAKLVGNATLGEPMDQNVDPADVGAGLVLAPQS